MAKSKKEDEREPLAAFRFSRDTARMLDALCAKTKRSRTKMIEFLIEEEFTRLGLTLPDEAPPAQPKGSTRKS